jgi:diaminohydroxyphosphoribosylaminopyrimidine deaminase/5-amino-6-(5-phosphoribosylamino)uracil reductase
MQDPERTLLAGDRGIAVPVALQSTHVECLPVTAGPDGIGLAELLAALAEREINEIQVEAGARLCGSLLAARLVDEVLIYQAPVLLGDGGPGPFALGPLESMAERTHFQVQETTHLGDDLRIRLSPQPEN